MGALMRVQPVTVSRRSDRRLRLRAVQMTERIKVTNRVCNQSGVKRDARAAELPDEDEQGGTFQQVEGLTTVDAEQISCEFSVEDDFEVDETAEGVDEEIVKAILAGKKRARRDGSFRNL